MWRIVAKLEIEKIREEFSRVLGIIDGWNKICNCGDVSVDLFEV